MKKFISFLINTIILLALITGAIYLGTYVLKYFKGSKGPIVPIIAEPKVVESVSYDRYAYQQLDEEAQTIYDQVYNCIIEYNDKVSLSTKDSEVLQLAFEAVMSDYGDLFWVNGYQYNTYSSGSEVVGIEFLPKYTINKEQRDVYQATIEAKADEWLSGISDSASDFDKALYVFETLINNVDYNPESDENQNILSVFLYQSTVCQGYADAAWYLLDRLDINSTIIAGTANGENHAWNLVYLDGAYYYMDITWGNSKYLDSNNDTTKRVNYAYLAMTSEELLQNHVITSSFEVPECLSNQDNYYVHQGLYYDQFAPEAIGSQLKQSYESGEAEISLKFSDSDLFSQVMTYFIDENHLSEYCRGLKSVYYLKDESVNVLTIQWN
ncbi:Transglutaminase-like superfamily protein [Pseudobutyrivibrio sp. ACV-2]|uniref:transglutaminase domain-containing protein n=1 Tax=Pseudobutyrivibrio sp. ACV-2 TaxID=1520801 RepID=UPI000897325C|nr:transglutaminase domain-containing protein [Pseudobutyrivibrio sp. ACV-2]SEA28637.1 Transglutaminase-like superfamily protein [Pseudobutyrivibrio sp. ACV-2]